LISVVAAAVCYAGQDEWTLFYEANLKNARIGKDWIAVSGQWKVTAEGLGKIAPRGRGAIILQKPLPRGAVRVEYTCSSEDPCDLSLLLGMQSNSDSHAVVASFGGWGNKKNELRVPGMEAKFLPESLIEKGRTHHVTVVREARRVSLSVDGKTLLEGPEPLLGLVGRHIGFYCWHMGTFKSLRVFSRDDPVLERHLATYVPSDEEVEKLPLKRLVFRTQSPSCPSLVDRVLARRLKALGFEGTDAEWERRNVVKQSSAFFPQERIENALANIRKYPWAAEVAAEVIEKARLWADMSNDELWALPFSPDVYRSMDVSLKFGCPNCGQKIYDGRKPFRAWIFAPESHPWKVQCPACKELFPKNDFCAFYKSGMGGDGLFHYDDADRSLLFNAEHPDPKDPKHTWAVDDSRNWEGHWFIAGYAYQLWWQRIMAGIDALSLAYVHSGDTKYSRKCAILLDRVADIYPTYYGYAQFYNTGWKRYHGAYVGVRGYGFHFLEKAVLAYDRIWTGIQSDGALTGFLSRKATKHGLLNPKKTAADISRNIDERIVRELLIHRGEEVHMNGNRAACILAVAKMAMRGAESGESVLNHDMPEIATADYTNSDGSGNEHAVGYDFGHIMYAGAKFFSTLYDLDKDAAKRALQEFPNFHKALPFQINLRCLDRFVPEIGDAGRGGQPRKMWYHEVYAKLFDLTGDPLLAQYIVLAKDGALDDVHTGLFTRDPAAVREKIRDAIRKHGPFALGSTHYPVYKLAIFRSGKGENRRALWINYNMRGSGHAHYDGMNIGLFAKGISLMPEHGYPEFTGGWPARHEWTAHTRSHITVLVDGKKQDWGRTREERDRKGRLMLISPGRNFQLIQADGREMYMVATRYERTCALIDIDEKDSYVVDVFRVAGGVEHVYNLHGADGAVTSDVLAVRGERKEFPGSDGVHYLYGGGVTVRPAPPWWVDEQVQDVYGLNPNGADVRLRLTHFTSADEVVVARGDMPPSKDVGIRTLPYVLVRRKARDGGPLTSTFISVIEPYEGKRVVKTATCRKLSREGVDDVVLTVDLPGGRRDIIVLADSTVKGTLTGRIDGVPVALDGSALWVQLDKDGFQKAVLVHGRKFLVGDVDVSLPEVTDRFVKTND